MVQLLLNLCYRNVENQVLTQSSFVLGQYNRRCNRRAWYSIIGGPVQPAVQSALGYRVISNFSRFKLQNINDIDIHGENMDSTINIHMSWRDSRLTWDPTLYGDIRYIAQLPILSTFIPNSESEFQSEIFRSIHLHPELIWHPIFSIVNRLNEFSSFDERLNQAEIDFEGIASNFTCKKF